MKKIVLLFFIFLSSSFLFAQQATGKLTFKTEVIDYGTIEQHTNGVRYFNVTNTGEAPVIIEKVTGSCGCTVASKPEHPILPGKSDVIKVKYATNRLGEFSKTVTVISNGEEKRKTLRIKGNIINL